MNSVLKRLMAGAAAAAMLLSGLALTGSAMADGTQSTSAVQSVANITDQQTLTVEAPADNSDILKDKTLIAVKLASYESAKYDPDSGLVTEYTVSTVEGLKTAINEALRSVTTVNGVGPSDLAKYEDNPMEWVVRNMSPTAPHSRYADKFDAFLTALKGNETFKNVANSAGTGINLCSTDGGSCSKTVAPGLYFILERKSNGEYAEINMFTGTKIDGHDLKVDVTGDGKLGLVIYKEPSPTGPSCPDCPPCTDCNPDKPPFEKTVTKGGEITKGNNGNAVTVGSDITFKLTGVVPDWGAKQYTSYYLAMNDRPSKGLTLQGDSFTAIVTKSDGTTTTLTAGRDYLVTTAPGANGSTNVKVLFAPTAGNSPTSNLLASDATKALFPVGSTITVTYTCTLNKDAIIDNPDGTTNSADLEYTNNPGSEEHGTTEDKIVKTYTGAFALHKVDAQGGDLTGARFRITDVGGHAVRFAKVGAADGSETYRPDAAGADEITMGAARAAFEGLNGTYTVTETYSPLTRKNPGVRFTVTVTMLKDKYGQYTGGYSVAVRGERNKLAVMDGSDSTGHTVKVVNVTSFTQLSKTGATWMGIYAVIAVLLIVGAIALTVSRRRVR